MDQTKNPGSAKKTAMKRLPPIAWILLPLVLGLLYALVAPLFQVELEHTSMAPDGAVLVERFRDLDTVDRDYYFPLEPGAPAHSAVLGLENNVKGLPGVDRSRPVYVIKMAPSAIGTDPALVVLPVSDTDAFKRVFLDPEMLEKGLIRRAKHLEMHGSWAAVGARRASVRGVGSGSLHAAERGEDFSIAAFLPGLAVTAVRNPGRAPWRGVLAALDVDVTKLEVRQNRETGEILPVYTAAPRLARILASWRIARLWSWDADRRVELELEPTGDARVPWLAAVASDPSNDASIPAPPTLQEARMWLRVRSPAARRALLEILYSIGVEVPDGLRTSTSPGGLLVVGTRAAGHPYAASFAVGTPRATPLDLSPLLGDIPAAGEREERAKGTLPLTLIERGSKRKAPAGLVARELVGELDVVGFGISAPTAITRLRALTERPGAAEDAPIERDGWHLVATFGADKARAAKLLGTMIDEHGLFGALHDRAIRGEIRTNGKRVRLTLTSQ